MKFFFAFLATLFLAAPAWAVDVQMGSGGNLVFDPSEVTISAGESVHFVNNMLPPHNVVVEDHPELSHESLAMMPGEEFDVAFPEAGDYTYWCGPHKGAGMIGTDTSNSMKIFLDTADLNEIAEAYETGLVDGVTTNPTLILRSGRTLLDVATELVKTYPEFESISTEVVADTAEGMLEQAYDFIKLGESITIKVPCTVEGLRACKVLSELGIKTNVTLIFSVAQAIMAAKAGATYVSPFVGRCNDNSFSGVELVRAITTAYSVHGVQTQVLAASLRDCHHVSRCYLYGASVVTMPPKVFWKMYDHVLTREGLDLFQKDWESVGN